MFVSQDNAQAPLARPRWGLNLFCVTLSPMPRKALAAGSEPAALPDAPSHSESLADATARAITAIEKAVGGREALVDTLFAADPDDDLAGVIGVIADPRMDARKLKDICRAAGITVGALMEAYKRGQYAQMQVQVVRAIAEKTPAIVADVLTRSTPHYLDCQVCGGSGSVTDLGKPDDPPKPCTVCRATGQVLEQPSLDRQKISLEMAGVLRKGGPQVVINQRTNLPATADVSPMGLVALLKSTDKLLYGRPPEAPVDGEVVPAAPEPD